MKIYTLGELLDCVATEEKATKLIMYIRNQDKEIERLNNIINKIKELVDNYEELEKTLGTGKPRFALYKLQKILKSGDKE